MSLMKLVWPAALLYAGIELWRKKVGDAKVRIALERIEQTRVFFYPDSTHALLTFRFPIRNIGNQQALIIDASAWLQPAGERFSDLQPVCRLINLSAPRSDGYWEAFIIPAGKEIVAEVRVFLTAPDIRARLQELGQVRFDILYKYYCRNPLQYKKYEALFSVSDFIETRTLPAEPKVLKPDKPRSEPDPSAQVLPLRTHLLRPGEDVIEICERYTKGVARPGDMITLAESAVAIMQGRLVYCEDLNPGFAATRLNSLFGMHSSLSSPYAFEMAIREIGLPKILYATAAGVVGRLRGRPGDFYAVAGRGVAAIDDCTGTLPPFDKHVVMGPARGQQLVDEIKARLGLDAAIVDANDLGKVDVFHISDPARKREVEEALKPNPAGNASEMTPLVLIRGDWRPAAAEVSPVAVITVATDGPSQILPA
jgi:hypothetical protein